MVSSNLKWSDIMRSYLMGALFSLAESCSTVSTSMSHPLLIINCTLLLLFLLFLLRPSPFLPKIKISSHCNSSNAFKGIGEERRANNAQARRMCCICAFFFLRSSKIFLQKYAQCLSSKRGASKMLLLVGGQQEPEVTS